MRPTTLEFAIQLIVNAIVLQPNINIRTNPQAPPLNDWTLALSIRPITSNRSQPAISPSIPMWFLYLPTFAWFSVTRQVLGGEMFEWKIE